MNVHKILFRQQTRVLIELFFYQIQNDMIKGESTRTLFQVETNMKWCIPSLSWASCSNASNRSLSSLFSAVKSVVSLCIIWDIDKFVAFYFFYPIMSSEPKLNLTKNTKNNDR